MDRGVITFESVDKSSHWLLIAFGAFTVGVLGIDLQLAPRHIRVNCICPTTVNTPMAQEDGGEDAMAWERAWIPLGRVCEPEEAATTLGHCPLCGADVVEQKKSFSCSRWQAGCKLTIWKSISGKRISARTAKALLRKGETSVLKGFKSKSGQPFSARLKLQEGKVGLEFDN